MPGNPMCMGGAYQRPAALGLRLKPPWLLLYYINGVFGRRLLNWFLAALAGVDGWVYGVAPLPTSRCARLAAEATLASALFY